MKDVSNLHVERLEAELFEREFRRRNFKVTRQRGGKRFISKEAARRDSQSNRLVTRDGNRAR